VNWNVSQTSKQLKTSISEHRNYINRNTKSQSVITQHKLQFEHEFDWDNVEILDFEKYLRKRLISEMFIKIEQRSKFTIGYQIFISRICINLK